MRWWLGAVSPLALGRLTCGLALATLLSACASLTPPLPTPGPLARLPPISESTINIRVSADYAAMSAAADKAIPSTIFDISAADLGHGVTFRLTGSRTPIMVSKVNDGVGFSSYVHVDGSLDSLCVLLTHCVGTLQVDGQVSGAARPTINPDWSLSLAPSGQFFISQADVRAPLFPAAVSIRDPLTKVLQGPFNDLIGHINDQVSKSPALRSTAEAAWSELGKQWVCRVRTTPPRRVI